VILTARSTSARSSSRVDFSELALRADWNAECSTSQNRRVTAMRLRKDWLIGSLAVFAVLMIAAAAWGKDNETQEFDVSPGGTIEFDLQSGGSVRILGWDQAVAKVSYWQSGRGWDHDVEITKTRNGLRITDDTEKREGSSKSLMFEIRLPQRFDIEFDSMGGALEIASLEGDFSGKTMGGSLTLRNAKGTVELKTMGGPINVTDSELDGEISTMGGTVYLADVVGDLDASSMGGNVKYVNVRDREGNPRAPKGLSARGMDKETVTITTMGGDINVDDAPEGAAVHTMGGDIKVLNASRFVRAKTMGGNIEIEISDGWVQATTMAGDIDVVIEKGLGGGKEGVELTSYSGDITLTVPADLSMDLDLTLAYTRNSSQNYKIISDVDLDIERSQEWDYDNGTPRKRIYATGKVRGGRYPIVIETINGDIRVRVAD
jgi:DUF4097 and DUF4098 domain-containing protein YvlB